MVVVMLINCPDCHKQMSDSAERCSHCGCVSETKRRTDLGMAILKADKERRDHYNPLKRISVIFGGKRD